MASPGAARRTATSADALALAGDLLRAARAGEEAANALTLLGAMESGQLAGFLDTDRRKIAFWLNIYNATVRVRLLADPLAYRRRLRFLSTPAVMIAGQRLSPNAIEHGILRRSAFLIGFGHVRNPMPSAFERRMRVEHVDPRIHFALNCGARSCPPLRTWDPATLDGDLESATSAYLALESTRSSDGRELRVPRLMLWFGGDFGGRRGIIRLLQHHGIVGPDEEPAIRFGVYDWTLALDDSRKDS